MNNSGCKALAAALLAALSAYFRELAAPLLLLLGVMALDWISGITAAWMNRRLDSRIGLAGIVKKVGYLLVVAVGMTLDYLICLLGARFGLTLEDRFFMGLLVTIWLVINECISVLENVDEMGLPTPAFLRELLRRLKRHAEDAGGQDEKPGDGA